MPFTFSHPAVILPFKSLTGHKVSLTALALGTMAPDFEFFFRMSAETDISHTLKGIFLFNLPVVILMAFLYHCWIRNPFLSHLPAFLRKRFWGYSRFDWLTYFKRNWLVVITSGFLGVVLHLICDDFTHHYGWTANNFSVLSATYEVAGHAVPGYHILQYLSSIVLGLILLLDALRLPLCPYTGEQPSYVRFWGVVVLLSVPTFFLRFLLRNKEMIMNDMIMTAIAAGLLGLLVASTVIQLSKKKQPVASGNQ